MKSNILFVAPHADDEVLGCGATIYKMVQEKHNVYVLIMTNASKSDPKLFSPAGIKIVRSEALEAHKILGVKETFFFDFPAPALDQFPCYIMAMAVLEYIKTHNIDTVYMPHHGDIHKDHKMVADAVLVACRPIGNYSVKTICAYETLSETEWAMPNSNEVFIPNVFVTCQEEAIETKMRAMKCYKSQLREFPSSRSLEALEALAKLRGATVSARFAEAFMMIRSVKE